MNNIKLINMSEDNLNKLAIEIIDKIDYYARDYDNLSYGLPRNDREMDDQVNITKSLIGTYINGLRDRLEPQVSKGDVQPVQTAGLSPKALEIVGKYGLDCPDCNNEGFYWQGQDDPEMIQCQFCYVEAKSKYNLKQDLIEMIGGLSC